MIHKLNQLNSVEITDMNHERFRTYGRIIRGFDLSELLEYMEQNTEIPETGNIYVASQKEMEEFIIYEQIKNSIYGNMDIQIGYCNGRNSTYNGFEYHKGSEVTIAVTDFLMVLGHSWDIQDNTYDNEKAEVFLVEKGTVFELYQTTLHLSPCKIDDAGFKAVIILPRGTNTPLSTHQKNTQEDEILLLKNKWIIAHKDREPLVKAGAHIGIIGKNKELFYQ
ncbi:MAG: DUF4867 family protein [Eubacteriales bacterium]